LASGGNDNKVSIWDIRKGELLGKHSCHESAVKAISWCPYKNNILVSGGGIKDKKIVVWNSLTQLK
jgi:WD40 repeat protein